MENGSETLGDRSEGRPRIVVVGSGFAGFTCARDLERRLDPEDAELFLTSPTDYLLYSPLLPEVATGAQDARNIAVPLHGSLKRTRIIPGDTTGVDLEARTCTVRPPNAPERVLAWDRLVLAPGGVTRSFPIPGLSARARGLKSLAEALYLRDHVLRQLELSGLAAKTVTLAYHLYALPSTPHRLRVGLDWVLGALLPCPLVQLGLVREEDARLAVAERTGIYAAPRRPVEERPARRRMKGARR